MAPLTSIAAAALLFLGSCQAHFLLKAPVPVGVFKDEDEPTGPCGGYTPNFSTNPVTSFSVGGDAIATQSSHPQSRFLYRITTDQKAAGNWTQIYPIVLQSGLGTMCASKVTVPESFVGQTAVLSVVANGPDGLLYQCAAVKFVSGVNSNVGSACTNSSSVTVSFDSDSQLTALVTGTTTGNASTSGTASGTAASATTTKNASPATLSNVEGLRGLLVAGSMLTLGAALMI